MIFRRLVVAVSLCCTFTLTSCKVVTKKKKICRFVKAEHNLDNSTLKKKKIKNGKVKCKEHCLDEKFKGKCFGFQQEGENCYLLKNPVKGFKQPPKDQDPSDFLCGMVSLPTETESPTSAPTASPTEPKSFDMKTGTICKPNKKQRGWEKNYSIDGDKCMKKCQSRKKCTAFSWFEKKGECTIYDVRPGMVKKVNDNSFCARVPVPTPSPTETPTSSPTESPTKAPVQPPIKCQISASLGFDFEDPDYAPYYGQHMDWMEVTKESDENDICSGYFKSTGELPSWCRYVNSKKDYDGAHVDNFEDYYYDEDELKDELATRETVYIKKAEEEKIVIQVYHWLFRSEYYPTSPTWNDHMMAPKLRIMNLAHSSQKQIGRDYSHPVSKHIRTHIKNKDGKWVGNPNYKGNFEVTVICNKNCFCETKGFKVWNGFETWRMLDGDENYATRRPRRRIH